MERCLSISWQEIIFGWKALFEHFRYILRMVTQHVRISLPPLVEGLTEEE